MLQAPSQSFSVLIPSCLGLGHPIWGPKLPLFTAPVPEDVWSGGEKEGISKVDLLCAECLGPISQMWVYSLLGTHLFF